MSHIHTSHTIMDCYLSSFHSAREKVNLTMMTFFSVEKQHMCMFNPVNTLIFSQ